MQKDSDNIYISVAQFRSRDLNWEVTIVQFVTRSELDVNKDVNTLAESVYEHGFSSDVSPCHDSLLYLTHPLSLPARMSKK